MGLRAHRLGPALAVAASVSLVLGGCGTKTVQGEEAERKISDSLTQRVGQRPGAVECPSQIEAKAGQKARCKLKASDGSEIGLTVTMTDDTGK
ncbi:MAG: DUF4333 domain-containing protein, partial [Actinobacteria bacterium]|nr:DUF4333 domain-containing protein [Actinomycetota bacterium]